MDSAPLTSPSSDERLWNRLRDRVDGILEHRKPKLASSSSSACNAQLECGKRLRDDTQLLMRGFDSVSTSLSLLSSTLSAAQQGLSDLAKPSLAKVVEAEEEPIPKRHCSDDLQKDNNAGNDSEGCGINESSHSAENCEVVNPHKSSEEESKKRPVDVVSQSGTVKKAKNLATSMATKAATLARDLKSIKSELCFMQERCEVLEEENRRFREGFEKGLRPEEDDLVRLQLEALLAEKSRLANENANLKRENECLHQLVEYHQLTSQDLSASYEQVIQSMCLDFSSPSAKTGSELDDENDNGDGDGDGESFSTPYTDKLDLFSSVDEHTTPK